MLRITAIKRRDGMVLILILFVAALMRFGNPGVVEFFHDDAMLATLAQDMVAGRYFPVRGINSSTGIPNSPATVYVMAVPFAINSNPLTAIYFVMALNVMGVGLLWAIAHRYFGRTVGLIAGLTYALSPWAVLYSRKIWAQDFHTPFILFGILLGIYGFWESQKRSERIKKSGWLTNYEWAQAFALPVLLFGFQIHFAAWALLPLYGVLLWLGWKRISWRAFALSIALSLLVMSPYLIGLWQTYQQFPERLRPDKVGTLADEQAAFSTLSLEYIIYLATGFGLETWVAPKQEADMLANVPPVALWWIIGGMLILGSGLLYRKIVRPFAPLLLLWAFLPAIALIPQWTGVFPHYFVASIPAFAILAGIGVAWMAQLVPQPYGRSIILVAYCTLLLTQGMYWRGVLRYVDSAAIRYPGFTVPLHYLHDIESALNEYDDVLVLSDGMAWDLHHESAVWPVLLHDTTQCVRTLIGDGYAVFPDGEFAVLQAPNMPENAVDTLYMTENPQHFNQRSADEAYFVHHFDEAPQWQAAEITAIDPVRYEGDVHLTGYHLSEGLLLLEWRLPQRTPGLDYQYSGHFINSNGEKIGQRDTVFWHGRHWCENYRLLTWIHTEVREDVQELHVFLYQLGNSQGPRYINANILDPAGNPVAQHAVIELGN